MSYYSTTIIPEASDILFVSFLPGALSGDNIEDMELLLTTAFSSNFLFVAFEIENITAISEEFLEHIIGWKKRFSSGHKGDICFVAPSLTVKKKFSKSSNTFTLFPDKSSTINFFYWEYKSHIDTLLFNIPADLKLVPPTRIIIRDAIIQHSYGKHTAYQVETIVDELVNNAIEHGLHSGEGVVEVAIAIGRDRLEVNVLNSVNSVYSQDRAMDKPRKIERVMRGFAENPVTDLLIQRGRGLGIVTGLSDSCEIDSSDDGTCVHIVIKRVEVTDG